MSARARRSEVEGISATELAGDAPIVVLAPHPDDESLGCGNLLSAAFAHRGACVICMTDGSGSHPRSIAWPPRRLASKRRSELRDAVQRLGGAASDVVWLGHPDGGLGALPSLPIARRIADICRDAGAHRLFAPSPVDQHADHKATAAIAREVCEMLPALHLYYFPVWSRWSEPDFQRLHSSWRMWRVSLPENPGAKAQAIAAHASQLGQVVEDDVEGFRLAPEFVEMFTNNEELFFEV